MKKLSFFVAFALAAVFIYAAGVSSASSVSFPESLSGFDTKQTGESGVYNFDKNHSFIGFKVKHMGLIEVPGFFRDFSRSGEFRCRRC
jgi:polyisoprenoid-binding protein YceI